MLLGSSLFLAVGCVRSPQTDHRFLLRIRPHENDVAGRISIRERQSDNFPIKFFRYFCVCDWEMGFVKMHEQWLAALRKISAQQTGLTGFTRLPFRNPVNSVNPV